MSFLTISKNFTYSRTIAAPASDVISFIQDPLKLAFMSPLILSCVPDETEPHWWIMTERLPIIGPIETTTTFRNRLVPTSDGVASQVRASYGVETSTMYTVENTGDGTCVIRDITTARASLLLMPYVYPTMSGAHTAVIDNIAAKALSPGGLEGQKQG